MATVGAKAKSRNKISGKKSKAKRKKHQQTRNNGWDNSGTQQQQQDLQSKNIDKDQKDHQRILPLRRAKRAATRKSLATNVTTYDDAMKKRRTRSNNNNGGEYYDDEENVETSHSSAVMSLGRSLQRYYGSGEGSPSSSSKHRMQYVGILVLDKAEELLSLSSVGKKKTGATTSNFLSELLLLPKIMKLNITVIVITNYATLDMTRKYKESRLRVLFTTLFLSPFSSLPSPFKFRYTICSKTGLNNSVAPSKSLSTISNGVHPMTVQFPAYKGNRVFQEVCLIFWRVV